MTKNPRRKHDHASFYKYVTTDVAKLILVNRSLRWSSPLLFNDPFDVPRRFDPGYGEEHLNKLVVERLSCLLENGDFSSVQPGAMLQRILSVPGLVQNFDLRMRLARDLRHSYANGQLHTRASFEPMRATWDRLVKSSRILCLTTRRDNAVMWAHYAANATGVVIEFACSDELDGAPLMAREVRYQDAPPPFFSAEEWADHIITGRDKDAARYRYDFPALPRGAAGGPPG